MLIEPFLKVAHITALHTAHISSKMSETDLVC